mmetsp:Transcript_10867/g.23553  ORF Transcript_10867/g.23553 Transcript_10867/m.23553 type:complete len:248 (+) Transcript_10867:412-1155(+)
MDGVDNSQGPSPRRRRRQERPRYRRHQGPAGVDEVVHGHHGRREHAEAHERGGERAGRLGQRGRRHRQLEGGREGGRKNGRDRVRHVRKKQRNETGVAAGQSVRHHPGRLPRRRHRRILSLLPGSDLPQAGAAPRPRGEDVRHRTPAHSRRRGGGRQRLLQDHQDPGRVHTAGESQMLPRVPPGLDRTSRETGRVDGGRVEEVPDTVRSRDDAEADQRGEVEVEIVPQRGHGEGNGENSGWPGEGEP